MHAFVFSVPIRAVLTAEYAVRGELVLRAAAIKQGGFKETPYEKLLECNSTPRSISNPPRAPSKAAALALSLFAGHAGGRFHFSCTSTSLTSRLRSHLACAAPPQSATLKP